MFSSIGLSLCSLTQKYLSSHPPYSVHLQYIHCAVLIKRDSTSFSNVLFELLQKYISSHPPYSVHLQYIHCAVLIKRDNTSFSNVLFELLQKYLSSHLTLFCTFTVYTIYIVQYLLKEIVHLLVMFYLSYYKNIFLGHWESCCTPWCMGPCHLMAPISRDWSSKLQQGTTMSQSNQHVSLNLRNSASSFTTY